MPLPRRSARRAWWILGAAALSAGLVGCGDAHTAAPATSTRTGGSRLVAPKTSDDQDAACFRDLATMDQPLSSYVDSHQGVALQALLTDGSAFCAFLQRGGGIDDAMESVVIGADSVESRTKLPRSVTTVNAIDSAALLSLCPKEQALVPAADRHHLRSLQETLAKAPTSALGSSQSTVDAS